MPVPMIGAAAATARVEAAALKTGTRVGNNGVRGAKKIVGQSRRTVREEFEDEKSVSARSRRREVRKIKTQEAGENKNINAIERLVYGHGTSEIRSGIQGAQAVLGKKKTRLSSLSIWMGLGVSSTVYMWQLIFALMSAAFFAAHAVVVGVQEGTWIGSIISVVIDFQSYFPGKNIGLLFYGLATILSTGIFIVYGLWFYYRGIRPFGTPALFYFSTICIACSSLPFTNIFPWTLVWIVYFSFFSLFSHET